MALFSLFCGGARKTSPLITAAIRIANSAGQSFSRAAAAPRTIGTPTSYALQTGSLPTGVTLNTSTGLVSGTTTAIGIFSYTIRSTDGSAQIEDNQYIVSVGQSVVTISTSATLPQGNTGTAYSQTLSASGTFGTQTWTITSGALPGGLSLSSTGSITGTPTATGSFSFTAKVTDAFGNNTSKAFSLTTVLAATPITIGPASLAAGTRGSTYSQTLTATNAVGSKTWSKISGTIPAGISLGASTGVLSGTPTGTGTFSFTVQVVDSNGTTATKAYSITVSASTVTISPSTLSDGTTGTFYSQVLSTTGAFGTKTWTLNTGALPSGLSLSSGGTLSGTPTASGSFSFSVRVTDQYGNTATRSYTMSVAIGLDQVGYSRTGITYTATGFNVDNFSSNEIYQTFGNKNATLTVSGSNAVGDIATTVGTDGYHMTFTIVGKASLAGQVWKITAVSTDFKLTIIRVS